MQTMQLLSQVELPVRIESLDRFRETVSGCAERIGISRQRIADIELALEEILVNIIHYAYPGKTGTAAVNCRADNDRLIIEVVDKGIAFDVLSTAAPDLAADITEREVGGLGIFLVRKLMDDVQYRRENDSNVLALTVLLGK